MAVTCDCIKDTYREKAPSNKTPTFSKSMNMNIWEVGTSNQHYSICLNISFWQSSFVGNVAFSILYFQLKNDTPFFWKGLTFLRKFVVKVKTFKTFKNSSCCHIKTWRSLKRKAILKNPSTVFKKNLCSFHWLPNETSNKKC